MGAVYRCADLEHADAPAVAVKVIKHDDPALVARFHREISVMRQLRGEHLARVLDSGEDDGAQFIAMELLEGVSLHERLRAGDPLPPKDALTLCRDVA